VRPVDQYLFRQLKLRHLHLLVALADLPTVGRVAEMLHVTQPAISRMIADLERGIGLTLFERNGRRIRPTPAGASLIRHARDMLAQAQRAGDELEAIANGIGGRLEVGLLAVAAAALVPQATASFKTQARATTVALHEGTLDHLMPALQSGRLDLVVGRIAKDMVDEATLAFDPLFDDPPVIVAAASHPLAKRRTVGWRDLDGLAWILPPVSAPMHRRLLSVLADHGLEAPTDVIESNTNLGNLPLLRDSERLCLEPRSRALELVREGVLWMAPLSLGSVLGPVAVIWRKDVESAPAVALFLDCLREAARAIQLPDQLPDASGKKQEKSGKKAEKNR
jgi:DNA-binding transcriptional LysR family regulator